MHPNKLFKFESGPNYLPANKIDIHIAVDTSGNSGIKAILIDGEERYFETLF